MNLRLLESYYTSLQTSLPEDPEHIHKKAFGLLYTRGLFVMMCVMLKGCQKENMELLWDRLPNTYNFGDLQRLMLSVFDPNNIDIETQANSVKSKLTFLMLTGEGVKTISWRRLTHQTLLYLITTSKDTEEVRLARLAQKWLLHAVCTNLEQVTKDIYVINEAREDMPESFPSTLITRYNAVLKREARQYANKGKRAQKLEQSAIDKALGSLA